MPYLIKNLSGKIILVAMEADKEETSKSGLVVTLNNDKTPFVVGKVVQFGDGIDLDDPAKSMSESQLMTFRGWLKGKRALFQRNHGTLLEKVDGVELRLLTMSSLVAVLGD